MDCQNSIMFTRKFKKKKKGNVCTSSRRLPREGRKLSGKVGGRDCCQDAAHFNVGVIFSVPLNIALHSCDVRGFVSTSWGTCVQPRNHCGFGRKICICVLGLVPWSCLEGAAYPQWSPPFHCGIKKFSLTRSNDAVKPAKCSLLACSALCGE
jgi:hypothetical protein